MNRLLIFLILLFALSNQLFSQKIGFELRVVDSNPIDDMNQMKYDISDKQFFVSKSGVTFSKEDLSYLYITKDKFGSIVTIIFTPTGNEKLWKYTLNNIGQHIGVIADGKLLYISKLVVPLRTDFSLNQLSQERSKQIAQLIGENIIENNPPIQRTVFIATESKYDQAKYKEYYYASFPKDNSLKDNVEVSNILNSIMKRQGYKVFELSQFSKYDLSAIRLIEVSIEEIGSNRNQIEILIGTINNTEETTDMLILWRGIFSVDRNFFSGNKDYIMEKIIKMYGIEDIQKVENW